MKKRTTLYLVLLFCLVVSALLAACITGPNPEPDKEVSVPSDPPDNPPPPPPPPPSGLSAGSIRVDAVSMEPIALSVLRGDYGPELRAMLSDEVSVVINKMSEAGIMSIYADDNSSVVMLLEGEHKPVLYDDDYLVSSILAGTYGSMARTNLHSFVRSFEVDDIIPK